MGFVEMGIVVEQVTVLKPGPKFTLAMLADRADPKGRTDGRVECWPSIRELVRRTAQSKSTVLRQLNYLQEIGLIEVEKRWHTDASGQARQATNRYIINLPGIHRGEFRADEVIYSHDTEPEPTAAPLGVTMTLKPKTPGHAKGSNLTPKGEYGCQNPQSMGVTGDTPRKTNINTNPSPSLPHDEGPPANPDGGGATAPGEEDSPTPQKPSAHDTVEMDAPPPPAAVSPASPEQTDHASRPHHDEANTTSSLPDLSASSTEEGPTVATRDWELIYAGLPDAMQDLPPREIPAIAEMIRQRVRGGWTLPGLRKTLGARRLPSEVVHLPGLVKARLRDDAPPHGAPPKKPGSARPGVFRAPSTPRPDELLTPQERQQAQQRRRALINQALLKTHPQHTQREINETPA